MHQHLSACWLLILATLAGGSYLVSEAQENRYRPEQFESDARDEWQNVDGIIRVMGLKTGMSIADIGGGSGYFSRPFARVVGDEGVVYCCDLATNLMDYLQEAALKEKLHNIITVYAAYDRPMLPPNSVDIIFFCNTNHHIENRVSYYKGLHRVLRSEGQVVVVDWTNVERDVGPPVGHSHDKSQVIDEMNQAGWTLTRDESDLLDYQYFLFFEPQSDS